MNTKFQASSHLVWLYSRFVWDLVGNPKDWFSHNEAHIGFATKFEGIYMFEEPQLLLDKAEVLKSSVYTKRSSAHFTRLSLHNEVFYCRFILTVLYDKQ